MGADNSYTVQYNHDRLVIVKRRPEKYSLQLATERRQRQCIPNRRRQAVPRTCRLATEKARSLSVERLVDGTTSMAESAERRRRRMSTLSTDTAQRVRL